ncbi:ATP-dependent RNA helicase HrpA [Gordonia sp. HNM0687]|uniref:ATP-dependent RNA helicase HrpA n=1 Tax=Gordonia mangrovi TaxID=2665643 RepID=A0A6L7GRY3_9ACTN|nr:ATP-dependent RNA helicase HrpA [Gordonia mangrovi]MXP22362.1 ATP-dependent RNA helicase HrpA [Gordonia mangrovi]UVF77749.1 ATP-dependent RNA helicase HrpA [Gordonia mangrovi]
MPAPTSADRRAVLDTLDELTIVDAHRLRRRLDKLGRQPEAAAWQRLSSELSSAQARVHRRRAAVPVPEFPPELPVSEARSEIAAAITDHQVVVVAGETGSGKTTQLPKICLELGRGVRGAIGHTQPRRIAASSVARRIAEETASQIGDAIGYSVRFTDRAGADTLVKVMTDGILLREIASDPLLRHYDTLIIDEAHERSLNIDFILGYLRRLLPKRRDLKVIITSATIEPDRFARHFADAVDGGQVPILEVSGRTYPVEIRYRPYGDARDPDSDHRDLDQAQAIDAAVGELWSNRRTGDILVFLPTERDIRETADALRHRASAGAEIVPLFARLSIADQQRVFAPSSGRRIVLATNVAETSLTVPGIRYVIDTGTARISRYSTRSKVNRLPVEPISQASARQRAGRCGRVAPGVCIRLYAEEDFDARAGFTDPEILRTNLAAVILQMASLRLGDVSQFPFVQPPDARAIRDGMAVLTELGAIRDTQRDDHEPVLTQVGRQMARIPVDPRLARMLIAARDGGCLDHVLVIAAALSIPDVRERPAEHREAADAAHRRFAVPGSEFLAHLELWSYLAERRRELSGNQFRRLCEREFLHFLRIREWQELHRQLSRVVTDLDWTVRATERDADAIHRAILAGLLGNIAVRQGDSREFLGARNTTLAIFPGSSLARKPPPFLMAAELVETSRLFAHTVAAIDPLWVEQLAGDLVRRSYSEPHWSAKRGAAMAYERVTLYGVPLVARRRVRFGPIDPPTGREMFIRHALVEGDWRTEHAFFHSNRALLEAAADVEHRARRRDVVISEQQLFDFYDARVGDEVVSARHFDSWWKKARRAQPDLLDLRPEDVATDVAVADTDFPGAWQQGETRLELRYRFEPGAPDDGVTVVIPRALLDHVRPAGFDWSVPGLRGELATELVRSLPKALRKSMAPAARFADLALSRLTPRAEPLLAGLARELSAITTMTVAPGDFAPEKIPPHLTMNFAVVDRDGSVLATDKSLQTLKKKFDDVGEQSEPAEVFTAWTTTGIGDLPATVTTTVAGQSITHHVGLDTVTDGTGRPIGVARGEFGTQAERDRRHAAAVVTLLDLAIAPLSRKITSTLDAAGRLALSQSPYRDVDGLVADCTRRAIRDLAAGQNLIAVRSTAAFGRLRDDLGPRVAERAPDYFATTTDVLRRVAPLRAQIDRVSGSVAADDVAEQLENLVFDGFVAATPHEKLVHVPRYLEAATVRLSELPGAAARDSASLAAVDRVVTQWNQRAAQLPAARREALDEHAHWLVEELRVGLFAQRLGTARPISEKRAMRALDQFS